MRLLDPDEALERRHIARPSDSEVHLWWADLDAVEPLLDTPFLSAAERTAVNKIRPSRIRRRAAVRRALLRYLLGGYLICDPAKLELTRSERGKPACPVAPELAFNCSSSGSLGLYGFATDRALGVDLEHRFDGRWNDLPVSRFLSPRERVTIERLTVGPDREREAIRAWVVKEALVKALGLGFSFRPTQIELGRERLRPTVGLRGSWSKYASAGWCAEVIQDDGRTIAAVASDGDWVTTTSRRWPTDLPLLDFESGAMRNPSPAPA